MKKILKIIVCIYFILWGKNISGQPLNDECQGAITLNVNIGQEWTNFVNGNSSGATKSTENGQQSCNSASIDDDVWYKFNSGPEGTYWIGVNGNSPMYYPAFEIYSGTCGNLYSVFCSTNVSVVSFIAKESTTYYIRVYSSYANKGYSGPFTIAAGLFMNDHCSGAKILLAGTTVVNTYGSSVPATQSVNSLECSSNNGFQDDDIWYRVNPTLSGLYNISINSTLRYGFINAAYGIVQPLFTIYTGNCAQLSPVVDGCLTSASMCGTYYSNKKINLEAGTNYYIRVYCGANNDFYRGGFNISITNPNAVASFTSEVNILNFGIVCLGNEKVLSFYLQGNSLNSDNIKIEGPEGFSFSNSGAGYTTELNISNPCGGNRGEIIFVRFFPELQGEFKGTIKISGGGALQEFLLNVSGKGLNAPKPSFITEPASQCFTDNDITYTTQPAKNNYQWSIAGTSGKDYTIVAGSISTNTITLKWLTEGEKLVTVTYSEDGCPGYPLATNTTFATHPRFNLSGTVTYDNENKTPLKNCKLILYKEGIKIDSTSTDDKGFYNFLKILNGSYNIKCFTTLKWRAVNPIDALYINRYFLTMYPINDELSKRAADVDNNNKINPIDALFINKRFLWMISKFNISDWLFDETLIKLYNSDVIYNIKSKCAGDVDGSYK